MSHKPQHKVQQLRFTQCVFTVGNIQNSLLPTPALFFTFVALVFSGSAAFYHVLPGQVLPKRANENQGGADQVQPQMGGGSWRKERREREFNDK